MNTVRNAALLFICMGAAFAVDVCPVAFSVALSCEDERIYHAFGALLQCVDACISSVGATCQPNTQCIVIQQTNATGAADIDAVPFKWLAVSGNTVNYVAAMETLFNTTLGESATTAAFKFSGTPATLWQIGSTRLMAIKHQTAKIFNIETCQSNNTLDAKNLLPANLNAGRNPTIFTTRAGTLYHHDQGMQYMHTFSVKAGIDNVTLPNAPFAHRILQVGHDDLAFEYMNGSILYRGHVYNNSDVEMPEAWLFWNNHTLAYSHGQLLQVIFTALRMVHTPVGMDESNLTNCVKQIFGYSDLMFAEPLPTDQRRASFSTLLQTVVDKIQQEVLIVLLLLGIPLLVVVVPMLILLLIFTMKLMQLLGIEMEFTPEDD